MSTTRVLAESEALAFACDVIDCLNKSSVNRNLALGMLLCEISTELERISYNVDAVLKLAEDVIKRAIVE